MFFKSKSFASVTMGSRRSWYFKVCFVIAICIVWMVIYASVGDWAQRFSYRSLRSSDPNHSLFGERLPRRYPLKLKHKIVHLDLKGMPPLVSYYESLFPLLRETGASGLLLEYEDMFPYEGKIKSLRSKESYTKAEIRKINELAKIHDLEIIPLVQTFGHLEFMLKLEEFSSLREYSQQPQAICPSNNHSAEVIYEMIDQVHRLHPDIKYLHIGADEVYQIGHCYLCVDRLSRHGWTNVDLFLDHVKQVAKYVTAVHAIRPIMWDDEFRSVDEYLIDKSGVGKLVDIVVWNYKMEVSLPPLIWEKYSRQFEAIWIGSAFKGANEPNSIAVNETLYIGNHYSWLDLVAFEENIHFKGIMLTGWQRYDHFSVPCEILPAAIPSLVSCMTLINESTVYVPSMEQVIANASEFLDCSIRFESCRFPGVDVYERLKAFIHLEKSWDAFKESSIYKGWMNANNLRIGFSSPYYALTGLTTVMSKRADFKRLGAELEKSLREIYPASSVLEWMTIFYKPLAKEIEDVYYGLSKVLDKDSYPRRPIRYNPSVLEAREKRPFSTQ